MANNAFTIFGSIFLDAKDTMKKLDSVSSGFDKTFETAGSKASKFVTDVGKNMSKVGTTMLGAATTIGGYAMKLYMPYEDSMAKIKTLCDDDKIFDGLRTSVLDLSSQLGMDAGEVGEAIYQGLSSGVSPENIADFTEKMGKLAKGGFTEVATATDVVTTALNAYGLEIENTDRICDILITTQNRGKTTVDQLASSLGQVIPIASANNVEIEQLGASYSILTANGISTAESGTKLKAMFDELSATGSKADEILKEVGGMSFKQMMENGYDTADALKILEKYAADNNITMNDLFSSTEAASAAMILAKDNGNGFKESLDAMKNSAGAANDNFETVDNTLSSKLAKSVETIKNAFIKLGERLVPIIADKIVPIIEKFTDWVGNLSDESIDNAAKWVEWGIKVGGILAVGGKVTSWIGNIGNLVSAISSIFGSTTTAANGVGKLSDAVGGKLVSSAAGAKGALTNLGGVGALLSSPAGWVALGVGAVVGLTVAFEENQKQLDKNQEAFDDTKGKFEEFSGKLRTDRDFFTELFGEQIDITFQANIDEVVAEVQQSQDDMLSAVAEYYKDKDELDHDGCTDYETHLKHIEDFEKEHQQTMEYIKAGGKKDFTDNLDYQEEEYKNYLQKEYGMTTEGAENKAKEWRRQAEEKEDIYNTNATEILKIVESCGGDLEKLDTATYEKLNKLREENANIEVELTKATAETISGIMKQKNVEAENDKVAEKTRLKERKVNRENYTKDVIGQYNKQAYNFAASQQSMMEKLRESDEFSEAELKAEGKRVSEKIRLNQEFATTYSQEMNKCIQSGGDMGAASNRVFTQIAADIASGRIDLSAFGNDSVLYYQMAIGQMIQAGAGADELKGALDAIPTDIRPQVIASISGSHEASILRQEIAGIHSKDVYITAHYTAAFADTGTATVAYQQARNGRFTNDYTMYSRAHGEEGFIPNTPKKAFAKGTEGFTPETEIENATGETFMPKDTLAKAIGGAIGNTRSVLVGEQGPELVQLPQGAKVKTHRETNNIINKTEPQIIQVVLDGKVIAQAIAPYTGKALADRVNKERW